jgi:hypothetical protein
MLLWGMPRLMYGICVYRYKKNEVFLDVVESVNLLVNSNGTVVRSEVMGALKMRTFLSGMPECKLGLNDKVSSRFWLQSVHSLYVDIHAGVSSAAKLLLCTHIEAVAHSSSCAVL